MRVNVISPYIHALNGRLRIKVSELRGLPVKALELEGQLCKIAGITHVRANPTTANVLVLYDSARIGQDEIFGTLQRLGYLRENSSVRTAARSHLRAFDGGWRNLSKKPHAHNHGASRAAARQCVDLAE